tara:strand:- start:405 stop:746 length:342 start_codon:yes stop_codon:yes gene_type:complete
MRLTKRQLKRIIREEYSRLKQKGLINESNMSEFHSDLQNDILGLAQDQGGEIVVDDVVSYMSGYANDPMGEPLADYAGEIEYEEARQIMLDMVASGMLIDDHEDFFSVHPNYM